MNSGRDVTKRMVIWVIDELCHKSKLSQGTGMVTVDMGDVTKSDTTISESLRASLKAVVRLLKDVPENQKDYHPGSNDKVLDLVHPSLFPLVYGKFRIMHDSPVDMEASVQYTGKGITLEAYGSFRTPYPWS
jgi:hypothetical protein